MVNVYDIDVNKLSKEEAEKLLHLIVFPVYQVESLSGETVMEIVLDDDDYTVQYDNDEYILYDADEEEAARANDIESLFANFSYISPTVWNESVQDVAWKYAGTIDESVYEEALEDTLDEAEDDAAIVIQALADKAFS